MELKRRWWKHCKMQKLYIIQAKLKKNRVKPHKLFGVLPITIWPSWKDSSKSNGKGHWSHISQTWSCIPKRKTLSYLSALVTVKVSSFSYLQIFSFNTIKLLLLYVSMSFWLTGDVHNMVLKMWEKAKLATCHSNISSKEILTLPLMFYLMKLTKWLE